MYGGIALEEMQRLLHVLRDVNEDVDFTCNAALIDDGIIDSFDIIAIIGALDEAYGIHIKAADIEPKNFNSVQAIYETVERYRKTV